MYHIYRGRSLPIHGTAHETGTEDEQMAAPSMAAGSVHSNATERVRERPGRASRPQLQMLHPEWNSPGFSNWL